MERFRGSRSFSGTFSLAACIMACTAAAARLATPEPAKAARSGDGPRSFSAAGASSRSSLWLDCGQRGAAAGFGAIFAAGQRGGAARREDWLKLDDTLLSAPSLAPWLLAAAVLVCWWRAEAAAAGSPVLAEFAPAAALASASAYFGSARSEMKIRMMLRLLDIWK